MSEPQKIWVDRSRHLDLQRCRRLRFLGYHAGSQHLGLAPVRKSIHLVLGGAVHAGLEVLLREGQRELDNIATNMLKDSAASITAQLDVLFVTSRADGQITFARNIENMAVVAALEELAKMTAHGVELDDSEKAAGVAAVEQAAKTGSGDSAIDTGLGAGWDAKTGQFVEAGAGAAAAKAESEPMLEITFEQPVGPMTICLPEGVLPTDTLGNVTAKDMSEVASWPSGEAFEKELLTAANTTSEVDWSKPVYLAEEKAAADETALEAVTLDTRLAANAMAASGLDGYLRDELAAQVEAMVRAYSRRRWRPLLEAFEVLEVEREGEWKLAEWQSTQCTACGHTHATAWRPLPTDDAHYHADRGVHVVHNRCTWADCACTCFDGRTEIWFASRADALLRERSTSYLYIESFKTTGSWDRRKEQDAQVDMQGLSEAVDIERRLGEAWRLIQAERYPDKSDAIDLQISELVSERTMHWLTSLPEPPRILGVRYEYLIKGPRRTDKNDSEMPNRYVADTPLIRAYMFAGLTADDRKWAHSYNWHTLAGKSSRLDYRSWKKAPVWRYMTVAAWIDMLDRGEVQAEAYDENGAAIDILAEQFIPPINVYRNDDSLRDLLETLEAEEVRVAQDVAAVYAVEGNPAAMRSELNKRFGMSLRSCSWPGKCSYFDGCHGTQAFRDSMESSGLFEERTPNHKQEIVQIAPAAAAPAEEISPDPAVSS